MNLNRKPVAVVVGATSKWQADGRNTALWPHATFQFMARTWTVNMKDYTWQPAVVAQTKEAEAVARA